MNKIFRAPDQEPVRHDDIISRGYEDWDARVTAAIAGNTAWRTGFFVVLGCLAVSVSGNVWQSTQAKGPQILHVVHDSIGGVITVSVASDTPGEPTQAMLKAALEEWVINARSVYVDYNALKQGLWRATDLIEPHTQADADFGKFINSARPPWVRAEAETVALENVVAVPPTAATIGPSGLQTWAVSWIEHVTSRDGQTETRQNWAGNITFTVRSPETVPQAQHNPNGLHIQAYSWTGK